MLNLAGGIKEGCDKIAELGLYLFLIDTVQVRAFIFAE